MRNKISIILSLLILLLSTLAIQAQETEKVKKWGVGASVYLFNLKNWGANVAFQNGQNQYKVEPYFFGEYESPYYFGLAMSYKRLMFKYDFPIKPTYLAEVDVMLRFEDVLRKSHFHIPLGIGVNYSILNNVDIGTDFKFGPGITYSHTQKVSEFSFVARNVIYVQYFF